ncbi:hypothetical protein [Micromonospora sp. NBC_01813]|uniref:hypothetical protein n=1 Tax=Micromonospora sp. NBC_01813 TaxID=2975988 RepID=UPI002DD83A16|nr:hypothetical protein [Micromonospora sp. NBC_01813]WSA11522.1 hypothetical protein OG958_12490 [Micromonospora sp. NBC_01813]
MTTTTACQACRTGPALIRLHEGDLRHAVRRLLRFPSQRNRDALVKCKEQLARSKEIADQHALICEVVAA